MTTKPTPPAPPCWQKRMVGAFVKWLRMLVAIYALLLVYAVLAPFRTKRIEKGLLEGMDAA